MDADDITTSNITIPINTYILANKFTIYVNNKFAHNRIYIKSEIILMPKRLQIF